MLNRRQLLLAGLAAATAKLWPWGGECEASQPGETFIVAPCSLGGDLYQRYKMAEGSCDRRGKFILWSVVGDAGGVTALVFIRSPRCILDFGSVVVDELLWEAHGQYEHPAIREWCEEVDYWRAWHTGWPVPPNGGRRDVYEADRPNDAYRAGLIR